MAVLDAALDKLERIRRRKEKKAAEAALEQKSAANGVDTDTRDAVGALEDIGITVDPSDVVDSKEKKKKRKRDAEAVDESESMSKEERKARKKARKDAKALASATKVPTSTITTTTTVTATPTIPNESEARAFLAKHSITIHTPPGMPPVTPAISFSHLNLPPKLGAAFEGFKEPTPIQACSWPLAMAGKDVVGIAETGSGKTLAFGIPALAQLIQSSETFTAKKSKKKSKNGTTSVSVLVMAPTRELAIQTHDTLTSLGAPFGIASVAVFGGVEKRGQVHALKSCQSDGKTTRIVVGTPGRILDLINDGVCDLSGVNYLVLDEADRMLDKGFENDIRSIISHTRPKESRQTLMFSATWPDAVRRLAATFQNDPVRVTVGSDDLTANSRVEQVVDVFDDAYLKGAKLVARLNALSHKKTTKTGADESRILVFVLYKREASRVENMLRSKGYSVGAIHGDMSQSARIEALENFKSGKTGLLVATDVAARGLDIPNVGAVINYSFPLTIEDYIHRIGRTGRGGRSGKSITFFTGQDHEKALAGELMRVLRESGFEAEGLKKFPMTIKKKTHSVYGAFFRDDIPADAAPTKIKF